MTPGGGSRFGLGRLARWGPGGTGVLGMVMCGGRFMSNIFLAFGKSPSDDLRFRLGVAFGVPPL